jgi:hypothetical protein
MKKTATEPEPDLLSERVTVFFRPDDLKRLEQMARMDHRRLPDWLRVLALREIEGK